MYFFILTCTFFVHLCINVHDGVLLFYIFTDIHYVSDKLSSAFMTFWSSLVLTIHLFSIVIRKKTRVCIIYNFLFVSISCTVTLVPARVTCVILLNSQSFTKLYQVANDWCICENAVNYTRTYYVNTLRACTQCFLK